MAKVANFEHVEIDASNLDLRDGTTIIEVTGDRILGSEDGSKRSSVSLVSSTVGRGSVLKAGDRVHLMTSGSGLNKGLNANNGQSVSLAIFGSGVSIASVLGVASAYALLVFCLLYTPCVATIATVRQELGSRHAWAMVVWQCAVAWGVAFVVKLLLNAFI